MAIQINSTRDNLIFLLCLSFHSLKNKYVVSICVQFSLCEQGSGSREQLFVHQADQVVAEKAKTLQDRIVISLNIDF
jgi:hypothetical protein